MTVFVRFGGFDEVLSSLETGPGRLVTKTIQRVSQAAFDEAQVGAARHRKTGALFQSLYNRAVPNGRAVGHDLDRAPQAFWVNFGTRPHEIRPKSRKALRFPVGGRFAFARVVHHPGYRGDGYLFTAADKAIAQFSTIVDAAMRESF